jgi:hypothetical protein
VIILIGAKINPETRDVDIALWYYFKIINNS